MVSAPPRALKSMASMPSRSMVTLATSRKKRTRGPLAEMSMFSLAFEPLNRRVSVPAWPSTVSLPSPGFHTNVSSPAPSKARSSPVPPTTTSSPWLPIRRSAPAPPFRVSSSAPAWRLLAFTTSRPPRALTVSWSRAASLAVMFTVADSPETVTPAADPLTRIVSSPLVPLTMTVSA